MGTVRLTTARALVRYLIAQRTVIDGVEVPLFPGTDRCTSFSCRQASVRSDQYC